MFETYKTINYYIERNMIPLSDDQIKRRLKELKRNIDFDQIARKIKKGNTTAWVINYDMLYLFKRKRNQKQTAKPLILLPVIESRINKRKNYVYEVTINLKNGVDNYKCKSGYDKSYYQEIVHSLFRILRVDMYYVIERDRDEYNHVHIAISEAAIEEIKMALDFILKQKLFFEKKFLHESKSLHDDFIRNQYALSKYLEKNYDLFSPKNIKNYIYKEDNFYN